jgi:transposase-like protein
MARKLDLASLRRRRPWTLDEGRAAVAAWRRSGQSVTAFARANALGAERVRWWCKRLEGASSSPLSAEDAVGLAAVAVVAAHPTMFEVAVGEAVVRVPADFDEAALRRLVRALGPC